MRRREFITGLYCAAAAAPHIARAQSAMPVIGFLSTGEANGREASDGDTGFRKGLAEAGYAIGRDVRVEFRFASGELTRLPELAADLVNRNVTAIVVNSTFGVQAAKRATTTIPIVFFTGGDPVELGFVESYNRPGGNLTGITVYTNEIWTKRVELIRECLPTADVVGMLVNPDNVLTDRAVREALDASRRLDQRLLVLDGSTAASIDAAFASLLREHAGALLVQDEPVVSNRREQILVLAAHYRIPAGYPFPEYVRDGGLMSYGPSSTDAWKQVGLYAGRIIKGTKPADLPVVLPSKFDLVINLKVAKALALELPPRVLAIADEVIE